MATESAVTWSAYTRNDCPYVSAPRAWKSGRCQDAQTSPRRTLAAGSPTRAAMRGSAYPRHPSSSPAWNGVDTAIAATITYHGSPPKRGHAPVVARSATATVSLTATM